MALSIKLIDGFETQGFERSFSQGGSVAISTVVHGGEGVRSVFFPEAPATANQVQYKPYEYEGSTNTNAKCFGFRHRFEVADVAATTLLIFFRDDSSNINCRLRVTQAASTWSVGLDNSSLASVGGQSEGAKDTDWHYIEVFWEESTSGAWALYVDGTLNDSGTGANFRGTGTSLIQVYSNSSATDGCYVDDIYFGEGTSASDLVTQQGYTGLDVFTCVGDSSSTTGGDALATGTWANVQELPASDTNVATYPDESYTTLDTYSPDALLVQTNLTGSVTDIDDNPDLPDANWLTASGSSTCRVSFPSINGSSLQTGAGLQEFRVLLRKNATGPSGSGNQRLAPDAIATQTNLTGSVTDIDDDPDSPDANWLTASGSSTLRTTFPTPTNTPVTGAGQQEFRVLLRKNATGPSGTGSEDVLPNGLGAADANLDGTAATIDDDPQAPGGDWRNASSNNANSVCHAQFATPTGTPAVGAGLQTFEIYARLTANGTACTYNVYLYENGTVLNGGTAIATGSLTSTTGQLITATWNASLLGTADGSLVECVFEVVKSGGSPTARTTGEVDAVRWVCATAVSETQPGYEVKLYENGSEVVAAGSATGTLTDAGGDTVVSFTWDATNLGTADGSLVECYVNQTSGADRYIEVGAVEWNSAWAATETQPGYEIKLYENGAEVVAAGSATGTLTDAGGNTVVSFTWNASTLATGSGANVECYINQTSGADRYIEVGAVEWNSAEVYTAVSKQGWIEADGTGGNTGPAGRGLDGTILEAAYFYRQKSTDASGLTQLVYGNDVDGTWSKNGPGFTVAWANTTLLSAAGFRLPTISETSLVGFGRRTGLAGTAECAEVIPQFAYAPNATTPPLETVTGSYALTGQAAAFKRQLRMQAASGSYSLTGSAATLSLTQKLEAAVGSYSITGQPVAFSRDYVLQTATGSYALTGSAAALEAQRSLPTVSGSYALTGSAADFTLSQNLFAVTGSYALSGQAVTFKRQLRLAAESGSYSLTGFAANLQTVGAYDLLAETGGYVLTGQAAALKANYRLAAESGSYSLTGSAAGLQTGFSMSVNAGSYSLTGQAASFTLTRKLLAETGSYSLTGFDVSFGSTTKLQAATGSYAVTGQAVSFRRSLRLAAEAGSYATSGFATALERDYRLQTETGLYALTGVNANLRGTRLRRIFIVG